MGGAMRILIVEDEEALAKGLRFNFEQEGYEVDAVSDGATAVERFEQADVSYDVVILDLMLPGMSGYDVCKAIREIDRHAQILVLSALRLSEDRARAFDAGANQYLTKPFALPELLSRIRNLFEHRRQPLEAEEQPEPEPPLDDYRFGAVHVDFLSFQVTVDGATQGLTTMEMQLLRYFIRHEGTVLSRSRILDDVWGQETEVTTRTIDNFVMRLRRLVEPNPAKPIHILSVRGTGYRFVAAALEDSTG